MSAAGAPAESGAVPTLSGQGAFIALAVTSVFSSACLMFLVQPMVARLLLPAFGGSPAVWSTALVFFQAVLLAGYAYAHFSVRRLGLRRQMALHVGVVLLPLLLLPPLPRAGMSGNPGAWPVPAVLAALATAVLLPFFALASNASLTQRWFAAARPGRGRDPYQLYAASNAGSFLALLAYPFLVEPAAGVRAQTWGWSIGYGLFVGLTCAMMWAARRQGALEASTAEAASDTALALPLTRGRKLGWLLRSAVPVSLLLSATLAITTDIVALPLFWVLPLALYLATYIVAFAWPERLPRRPVALLAALALVAALALALLPLQAGLPLWLLLVLALAPLLFGGLLCHLDLARDRPPPQQLTAFYLWIALGGVLGGILNSLVAPRLFSSVAEFPLTLALLAWLLPAGGPGWLVGEWRRTRHSGQGWVVAIMVCATVLVAWQLTQAQGPERWLWLLVALALMPVGALIPPRMLNFALAATLVAGLLASGLVSPEPVLDQARSFFGVLRIVQRPERRMMLHGTTIHGSQSTTESLRRTPQGYYYPTGPLGSLVAAQAPAARIGVVGLGTGALATLTRTGQRLDFFDIDPLVETLARRHFSYLQDAAGEVRVTVADGRLGLAAVPDGSYDMLVLDAFSSDSIPAHLLTAEALELYQRKLKPGGLVVFHISHRSLDLARVFRGWSSATGQSVAVQRWEPDEQAAGEGGLPTLAVALAPAETTVRDLVAGSGGAWQLLPPEGRATFWTDDSANLMSVLGKPAGVVAPPAD